MSDAEKGHGRHRPWSQWSARSKGLAILGIVVGVPAVLALFGAVTMALWNWLMPSIFGLPEIRFWQALGLLVLSHILFKGGHAARAGRGHWKRRQIWKHMHEEGPEAGATTA